jgi:hypothetical protein
MSALPEFLDLRFDTSLVNISLGTDLSDNCITAHVAPVFAAAHLGFNPMDLRTLMEAFELTPSLISEQIKRITYDLREIDTPDQYRVMNQGDSRFDTVIFLQKIVQAWCIGVDDPLKTLQEVAPCLAMSSEHALAVMSLNINGFSLNGLLDHVVPGDHTGSSSLISLLSAVGDVAPIQVLGNIANVCSEALDDRHCPGGSVAKLLKMSGALNPYVLRKSLGHTQVWEKLLMGALDNEYSQTVLREALIETAKINPVQIKQLLMSLEFKVEDQDPGEFCRDLGFSLELLAGILKQSPLEHMLEEEAFLMGFFTHHMTSRSVEKLNFLHGEAIAEWMCESQLGTDLCARLTEEPSTLLERLMRSQMRDPEVLATSNQYLLWGRLQHAIIGPQDIDPTTANRYILRMVNDFQSLKPRVKADDSVRATQTLPRSMSHLSHQYSRSMSSLVAKIAPLIEYESLRNLPTALRDDLGAWGLDLRKLGVSNEEIIADRFSSDLGL